MKFSLQWSNPMTREQLAIINAGCDYRIEKRCTPELIPIGDVPYCEAVFGNQPLFKQFYPDFLKSFMHRRWWGCRLTDLPMYTNPGYFIKDATQWKSDLRARISKDNEKLTTPHYFSDIVEFIDEWRYYVACGEIIASGWYQGKHEDAETPEIEVDWPEEFSGAVDFGTLQDGKIALVEAHAPFACGWYGDDPRLYAKWQGLAWNNADFWLDFVEVSK